MEEKIEINGEIVKYIIEKKKIKNVYLQIKDQQIIIKVPMKYKKENLEQIIIEKIDWIKKSLKKEEKRIESEKKYQKMTEEDILKLKKIIEYNVEKYTKKLEVYPSKITIKDMKSAWGSCSSKKNISFNVKLAIENQKIIEYVVLHELVHLKEMNHSKRFWNTVEKNMPEYKLIRKKLKRKE